MVCTKELISYINLVRGIITHWEFSHGLEVLGMVELEWEALCNHVAGK